MATTTTNFGWDIPQSTDLVKDGATAIAALGQDIDTAFVDFKGGTTGQVLKKTSGTDLDVEWGTASSGLTLINTTSFSAVASQSINDVFSSTYDNYKIIVEFTGSTGTTNQMRLRVSGADNTTSNYTRQTIYSASSTLTSARSTSQNTWFLGDHGTSRTVNIFDLISPNLAQVTGGVHFAAMYYNSTTENAFQQTGLGFNAATQFTGFTIYPSSGTITGTVSVYGYSK
jgi:hypothetical protein